MERILKPDRLELDPSVSGAGSANKAYTHWKATFTNFLSILGEAANTEQKKLLILINYVSSDIYNLISAQTEYAAAIAVLDNIFIKEKNESYARHLLLSRTQKPDESIDQYMIALQTLAKECKFEDVTAAQHREQSIRTAFIGGVASNQIRQRLLEDTKNLNDTLNSALTLEQALKNSEQYARSNINPSSFSAKATLSNQEAGNEYDNSVVASTQRYKGNNGFQNNKKACDFCGHERHYRPVCPARNSTCSNCGKKGHWAKVCRSNANRKYEPVANAAVADTATHYLSALSASTPSSLEKAIVRSKVNDSIVAYVLFDSGSSDSFISSSFVQKHKLSSTPYNKPVTIAMASESCVREAIGVCVLDVFEVKTLVLNKTPLMIMDDLCCDIIVGHDIIREHEKLVIHFGGPKPAIEIRESHDICALRSNKIEPFPLFANLSDDVHPIACKTRKYSKPEVRFIDSEIARLHKEGIIEPSNSPWRAQVLVTGLDKPKPRLVIDYSRTINKFTLQDAYPLPNRDTIANKVASFRVFSAFDLRSAYHQIPILDHEKPYTAFEASGRLWQFKSIPFGVMNGGATFQRIIDRMIDEHGLKGTFAYLDNVTVCGIDQNDHDYNVDRFLSVSQQYGITLNEDKTVSSVGTINTLGYLISEGVIKPDPDRMQPLLDLPVPHDPPSLKRVLGLFSYYSQWVDKFSDLIRPLLGDPVFPLSEKAVDSFHTMKSMVVKACVVCPKDSEVLVLESDASDFALSACLNQSGKPVAFFSRTLKAHERKHAAVEKEACAIVEACRKWRHFLTGRRFLLVTDQEAVSYMFDKANRGKIKNSKIQRWRVELSCFDFDIKYRPGPDNVTADCLTRAHCSAISQSRNRTLRQIHIDLCHPGITRLSHFVRSRNLPFSIEDIKQVVSQCDACARLKPQYFKPKNPPMIQAMKPFDRLSLDFKGPLPTSSKNKYLLTIIDEYSRFPFAYPCSDIESSTVIRCLTDLFAVFGTPGSIHSDNGPSLISSELTGFFINHGIAFSNSSRYNPQSNGQVERYNGVIWKSIELALYSEKLDNTLWEHVLPVVLHSLRTLLCTATNQTPHERLFSFNRRSATGSSLPSWLLNKGKVLVKRHVRRSKYEPLCDEVDLVAINPTHARVRFPCGREAAVSLRHLAPLPNSEQNPELTPDFPGPVLVDVKDSSAGVQRSEVTPAPAQLDISPDTDISTERNPVPELRRSKRSNIGVPPDRNLDHGITYK